MQCLLTQSKHSMKSRSKSDFIQQFIQLQLLTKTQTMHTDIHNPKIEPQCN